MPAYSRVRIGHSPQAGQRNAVGGLYATVVYPSTAARSDESFGMILTVCLLVGITIAIAAFGLAPRLIARRVVCATTPDAPCAFGADMAWLAVRTTDTALVVERLGLGAARPANWSSGLGTVHDAKLGDSHIFVSPPVRGWTLVVGTSLPHPLGARFVDKTTPLLEALGAGGLDVQMFANATAVDYFVWARVQQGRVARAFAIGDVGVIWNRGKTTADERALGLSLFELRGVEDRQGDAGGELILYPTLDHLLRLAARWSLDPATLGQLTRQDTVPGTAGVLGLAPLHWRSERMRRAA
jgi:hypothetical protein